MYVHDLHAITVMIRCWITHCSSSDKCWYLQHVKIRPTCDGDFSLVLAKLKKQCKSRRSVYRGGICKLLNTPSVILKRRTYCGLRPNFWNHNKDRIGVRMPDCPTRVGQSGVCFSWGFTPMKSNTTTAGYSWSSSVSQANIGVVPQLHHDCNAWHL